MTANEAKVWIAASAVPSAPPGHRPMYMMPWRRKEGIGKRTKGTGGGMASSA